MTNRNTQAHIHTHTHTDVVIAELNVNRQTNLIEVGDEEKEEEEKENELTRYFRLLQSVGKERNQTRRHAVFIPYSTDNYLLQEILP